MRRFVAIGGVVFGGHADNRPGGQPGDHAAEPPPVFRKGEREDGGEHDQQAAGGENAVAQRPQQALEIGAFPAANQERAQDRRHDAGPGQQHRKHRLGGFPILAGRPGEGYRAGGKRHRGNNGRYVGLEQVGAHPGHIAHVVAHVVGDDAGVAGVVLGDAGLDLAHQIGADVGGFGENSAADAGEQGDGAGAEPEAGDDADVLKDQVQDGYAEQSDADHADAHHRAAGEGDAEGGVQSALGGGGGADIGAHGDIHPDETGARGAERPGQVGYGGGRNRQIVVKNGVIQRPQHHGHHGHKGQERHILPPQEGPRAGADGVADAAHKFVPGLGAKHTGGGKGGEKQSHNPGGQGNYQ